jgi:hypothetical protein
MSILKQLYDSEDHVTVESFWDAGLTVRIGDRVNPR